MKDLVLQFGGVVLGFLAYTIVMCYIFWQLGFNKGYVEGIKIAGRRCRDRYSKNFQNDDQKFTRNTSLKRPVYIKRDYEE